MKRIPVILFALSLSCFAGCSSEPVSFESPELPEDTAISETGALSETTCVSGSDDSSVLSSSTFLPDDSELTDYLMVHFAGNGSGQESIYLSISETGLTWKALNLGSPVLRSKIGTTGVRDPFILRKQDGSFVIIATDLCIAKSNDWWQAQINGSSSILIWESDDLINWSEPRLVDIHKNAGCVWAPEAFYDEENDDYIVFWAARVPIDNYGHLRMYYSKTADFVEFTEPAVWIDYSFDTIDSTILKEDDTYYRFTKYEGSSRIILEKTSSLLGKWETVDSGFLKNTEGVEGPTAFKLHPDDAISANGVVYDHILYADDYGGSGYFPILIGDLESGLMTRCRGVGMPGHSMPSSGARHGTVLPITHAEYESLKEAMYRKKIN